MPNARVAVMGAVASTETVPVMNACVDTIMPWVRVVNSVVAVADVVAATPPKRRARRVGRYATDLGYP